MFGRDSRFRVFLAFLILVLVLVNSQSLQLSSETRALITESFERAARAEAELIALETAKDREDLAVLGARLGEAAARYGLISACLLDWNARLLTGGDCTPPVGNAFDRLDRDQRRRLLEEGWVVTDVVPPYDPAAARATGYLVTDDTVLRIEARASAIAEANRRFRTTILYQVSALTLVLLAMMLFVHSLLAPHRRLVAEARTVASELTSGEGGPSPPSKNEGEFLLGTFQEVVSRLKVKEQELEALHRLEKARADASEALASDIIRSMTTGLVSLDPSGIVAVVNPAAERILAVREEDCLGKPFAEGFPGSSELLARVEDALSSGASTLRGQVKYAAGSETRHLGVSVIPLLSPEGRGQGALCLTADLTEVVELRERLFLKDNLARLGEMAAGIAHEFRNALATILGNARLLRNEVEGEPREVADALIQESQALSHVVTEFLQFARPGALAVEPLDLRELVDSVLSEQEERAAASGVELRCHGDRVRLVADERLLQKAISNLIGNAIDSLADAESDGETEGRKRVEVELGEQNGQAVIRVVDNGPGISHDDRERIFTPFFTRKEKGTGLGLSVVQKVVVMHNGTIELESPSRGASFVICLPLTAGTAAGSAQEWV